MNKDSDLLSLRFVEPDFERASKEFVGQTRLIHKDKKYWLFSSVREVQEEVESDYNPASVMFDLMDKPRTHENHVRYFNAYMDLICEHTEYHTVIRKQYKLKLVGYPIYSYWYNDIETAKKNSLWKLNNWRAAKLAKRDERVKQEIGQNYYFISKEVVDSKAWCIAPKAKYHSAKYESMQDLIDGCDTACVAACKANAIVVNDQDIPGSGLITSTVNHNRCTNCGDCVTACPTENIVKHMTKIRKLTFAGILERIRPDKVR